MRFASDNPKPIFTRDYWKWSRYNDPHWMRALYVLMFILNAFAMVMAVFALVTIGYFALVPTLFNALAVLGFGWLAWPTMTFKIKEDDDE